MSTYASPAISSRPSSGSSTANRARALAAIDAAAAAGAQVVVLPELVSSGYVFHDADEARALAEPARRPDARRLGGARGGARARDRRRLRGARRRRPALQQRRAGRRAGHPRRLPQGAPVGPREARLHARATSRRRCSTRRTAGSGCSSATTSSSRSGPGPPRCAAPSCSASRRTGRASRGPPASGRWRCCARWSPRRRTAWRSRSATAAAPSAASSGSRARRSPAPTAGCSRGRPRAPEPALLVADVDLAAARDKALGPRNDVLADRRPALYAHVGRSRIPPAPP